MHRAQLLSILLAVVAALLPARIAEACLCASDGPARNAAAAREVAQLVIEAKVQAHGPVSGYTGARALSLVEVKAHRGVAPGTSMSLDNGGDCAAAQVEVGGRYLFYLLDAKDKTLTTCDRVVELASAQDEIAVLEGKAGAVADPPAVDPPSTEPPSADEPSPEQPGPAPALAPDPPLQVAAKPARGGCAGCAVGNEPAGRWYALAVVLVGLALRRRARFRS
jgi:MYXO-CTERM domain-containing protein